MTRRTATGIGFIAILTWALLALFTAGAGSVPPFLLATLAFGIGGGLGVVVWVAQRRVPNLRGQPPMAWIVGATGLSLYHVTYFLALQNAPPVEASLIAYLWPLLIVVFSAFLPGEHLRLHHIVGALLGLMGAALIVTRGAGLSGSIETGHLYAVCCALIWSGYSVLSRRFGDVPTDIVVGFCVISSLTCAAFHLAFETTVWPDGALAWGSVVGLGLLPMGLAFYVWDYGCKHGDIQVLGALSYAAPLLSTFVLLIAGVAVWHWSIGAACVLITLGAVVAAKNLIRPSV